jgi:hypothetical protein
MKTMNRAADRLRRDIRSSTWALPISDTRISQRVHSGSGTAITGITVYTQSIDVASVAANTSAEQTFTVTGLATTDKVFVIKPSLSAGLVIGNARVSAANTLGGDVRQPDGIPDRSGG